MFARAKGQGCPGCNSGWTLDNIREFVRSLGPHLQSMTAAEIYLIFQQSGLLDASGKGKAFIKALTTGQFPQEEIDRFLAGNSDQPNRLALAVEEVSKVGAGRDIAVNGLATNNGVDDVNCVVSEEADATATFEVLPTVSVPAALDALNVAVAHSSDVEAIEFLVASAKEKLWRRVFLDEGSTVDEVRAYSGSTYADTVRRDFLREYDQARNLKIPQGYSFKLSGMPVAPNLMQRLVASRIRTERRLGNWSGTGSGKTLSAILSSRVVGARLTVICCPNSVVEGWANAIKSVFPDSHVVFKTFEPNWRGVGKHRFVVLNYEAFQQSDSDRKVRAFTARETIDFVVVDEIQYARQRYAENLSRRRQMVGAMLTAASKRNAALHVLGMSATPVINNLHEGKALVELVTGKSHDDLGLHPTVPNCMKLHQRLTTSGPRWMPNYTIGYEQREIEVDCSVHLDEIRQVARSGSPLLLEQILTKARLPTILDHIVPKTLIYTHYVEGVIKPLRDAIEAQGWRVGFYTGEEKSGLEAFLGQDVDVLIGSSAISTGVDGLQRVCDRVIINVLPWTNAEFEQLKGRVYRQGQASERVVMIVPITRAEVNGQEWSWCKAKMQRLRFKKSIADAAVDGVVPEGHLRSPERAYRDLTAWLLRLDEGRVTHADRPAVRFNLPEATGDTMERRRARYGDLSRLNALWNRSNSTTTHERLQRDPAEWKHYHEEYRAARASWTVVPFEEMINWARKRSDLVIGDFGCGEAKLGEAISDRHVVHSFDHVAVNDDVVACDMAHVPLEDETLDVVVFSLSLMGANIGDYVREAYRVLKLDGWLQIYEATSRFADVEGFVRGLRDLGFGNIERRDLWKFTHISARKSEHQPRVGAALNF